MPNQSNGKKTTDSTLPKFMSEPNYEAEDTKQKWVTQNIHRMMIWISVVWFAIVLIYITQFFGWSNLFLMMPNEFGGFLAGVTMPLAVIWIVIAYIDRGSSFKHEAKVLHAYMNQLVYPEEGTAKTAKAVADAIRSQVIELQEVTRLAATQTEKIKQELGGRVEDFAKLVATLDNYSSKTIVELSEAVKSLVDNMNYISEKAESSTGNFKNYVTDFSYTTNSIQKDISALMDGIIPRIQEIKRSSEMLQGITDESNIKLIKANEAFLSVSNNAGKNLNHAADIINIQTGKLDEVSSKAFDACNDIYKTLDNSIVKIDQSLQAQSRFVSEHAEILEKKSDALSKRFSEHRDAISVEADKVVARANVMEESIAMRVRELQDVSDNVIEQMQQSENSIQSQITGLSKKTEIAVEEINNVIGTLSEETNRLAELSSRSIANIGNVGDEISNKSEDLAKLSDSLNANLARLTKELVESTDKIKIQSDISITGFNGVAGAMKKNSDILTEASSIVVSQSKISEASLAQQQRHITGSVAKIEEIRMDLKRQMDELAKAAAKIDEEATLSVNNLKSQMESVLQTSAEVVNKTKSINDNLVEQANVFDAKAAHTLSKVDKLDDVLSDHYKKLDAMSKKVVERSTEIADNLKKQTDLIGKTTDDSSKTFSDILNAFDTQSTLLNSVAENTVGYVSDVVQALDEKAATINLLFKHQENEFFQVCERLDDTTKNIGAALKKQINTIEQSADRVFARMTMLEEDVNTRAEAVVTNTTRSIDKLAELSEAIAKQNQDAGKTMQEITDKLNMVSDGFKANISGFNNVVKEVRDETGHATASIINSGDKIKEVGAELTKESRHIGNILDGHLKILDVALVKTKSQSDAIRDTLEHQKESLSDIVNVVSTQSRLGEASLAQQYKTLTDTANEVSGRMTEINAKFKANTDTIFETSNKLSYEFDVLGDKLIKAGEDITKTSKKSVKEIEAVNISLSNCTEELAANATSSSQKVKTVMQDYETYIASFNTVTAEASTGVIEINNLISQQNDKMLNLSEGTKELVDYFNNVLNATSKDLTNRANQAYDKVKGLGESLKSLSIQLEEATKMSVTHFDNSGEKLRAAIGEIAGNAERISNEIRSSGEVFLKQSGVLVATTESTMQKVTSIMTMLNASSENFVQQTDDIIKNSATFNSLVEKQLKQLAKTTSAAQEHLTEVEKQYAGVKIDNFLKEAGYIFEKLETIAVDISRVFSPDIEEDLWKKYYAGDTAVFIRHLAKNMTKQQIQKIREEFEKNVDFRALVTRYLSDFEMLLNKAKTNERSGILLSVLSGADVGKLYFILAKALDKIH